MKEAVPGQQADEAAADCELPHVRNHPRRPMILSASLVMAAWSMQPIANSSGKCP
jgi:hypothetical protein